MDPMTIGAGISAAAGLLGGSKANKAAKKIAREQMAFQEKVLQSQHQWQVADLKAAGLNPRLSATLGGTGGASGAMAPVVDESRSVVDGINSAVSSMRAKEEIKNMKETNNAIKSQTDLNNATAANNLASANNTNVSATLKSRLIPAATAVGTAANKGLSTARDAASEYRNKGFKQMFMESKPSSGGLLKPLGGYISDALGF